MGNRIDGGQSAFEQLTGEAADFLGIGDDEDVSAKPAMKKADPGGDNTEVESDAYGDISDVAGDFWDDTVGTVSKAGAEIAHSASDAVGEIADIAAKSATKTIVQAQQDAQLVRDVATHVATKAGERMLDDASDALNEIAQVPEELAAEGVEIFLRAEQAKVDFAHKIDRAIEKHPPEVVEEAASDVLEGTWDIAGDVAKAYVNSQVEGAKFVGNALADSVVAVDDVRGEAKKLLYTEVITAGAEFAVGHGEALQEAGAFVEAALDNPVVDAFVTVSDFTMLGTFGSSRDAALKLASAAKNSKKIGQDLLDNPEKIALMASDRHAPEIATDLKKIPIGDRMSTKTSIGGSLYAAVGGEAGLSTGAEAVRVGEQTYEVTLDVGLTAKMGLGAKWLGEGLSADLTGNPGGKVVMRFDGPDAAENAARIMAASSGNLRDLIELRNLTGGEVVEQSARPLAIGLELSLFDAKIGNRLTGSVHVKEIDGVDYAGATGSVRLFGGLDTTSVQINDNLAKDWLNSPATGNPAVDAMLGELPGNLVSDLKQIYGPADGVKFAGGPEISASIYEAIDGDGPTRAEFKLTADLQVGRSTLKNSQSLVIPDLEALAGALGMNSELLADKLSKGELTAQQLMQSGAEVASLIEIEGPKVVFEKASLDGYSFKGFAYSTGTIHSVVLHNGAEAIDAGAELRKAIDYTPGESSSGLGGPKLGDQAQNDLLLAHAGRV